MQLIQLAPYLYEPVIHRKHVLPAQGILKVSHSHLPLTRTEFYGQDSGVCGVYGVCGLMVAALVFVVLGVLGVLGVVGVLVLVTMLIVSVLPAVFTGVDVTVVVG